MADDVYRREDLSRLGSLLTDFEFSRVILGEIVELAQINEENRWNLLDEFYSNIHDIERIFM
jgi:hypothetical protein